MQVRINTHGNPLPESHGEWIDLCTAEETELGFLDFKIVSLGISVEIPAGYYAHIVPRSSTFKNWGVLLANSMGVIENTYCGDGDVWGFPAICLRREGVKIPKGTRICQFRLVEKAPAVEFIPVQMLGNADRGGYGSTGTRAAEETQNVTPSGNRCSRVERQFGKRETWNMPKPVENQGPYKGFLMVKCEECGNIQAYCARNEAYSSRCKACGAETPLENLKPLFMNCKCGKEFKYRTNINDKTVTNTCLGCGNPVDMELNGKGTAYVTIGYRRNEK